ncbi:MAG: glycosyltransferase 87 family protein, partial [Candidatus Bathyarchaeia archaeon]
YKSRPIDVGRITELAAMMFFFEGLNPYTSEIDPGHGAGTGFYYFNGYRHGPLTFIAYAPFIVLFKMRGIYVMNFFLNLGSLVLIYLITREVNPIDPHRIGMRAAIIWASCYLIQFELFEMGVTDILSVFFLLLSLYMFLKKNDLGTGVFLGMSFCAKLLPAAFLFLLFIVLKWRAKFIVGFALPVCTFLLPFLIMSFEEFTANVIIYNLIRPADNTSMLYFIPSNLAALWILLESITLMGLYANWYRSKKNELDIFFYFLWIVSTFLIFNKILHRNYLIWVIPFICIVLSNSFTLSQHPTYRQLKSIRERLRFKRNQ